MEGFTPKATIESKSYELSERDQARAEDIIRGILDIDEQELLKLRERVRQNDGYVRIFVHPFFNSTSRRRRNKFGSPVWSSADFVEEGALKHIRSTATERTAPLFLFEEAERISDAEKKIQDAAIDQKGVYVIPTSFQAGRIDQKLTAPLTVGSDLYRNAYAAEQKRRLEKINSYQRMLERSGNEHGKRAARELISGETEKQKDISVEDAIASELSEQVISVLFKGLGVKKIMVGGLYIEDSNDRLLGCVTHVIKIANRMKIPVALSKYHGDWEGRDIKGKRQKIDS
jgi:hypothetical protein